MIPPTTAPLWRTPMGKRRCGGVLGCAPLGPGRQSGPPGVPAVGAPYEAPFGPQFGPQCRPEDKPGAAQA